MAKRKQIDIDSIIDDIFYITDRFCNEFKTDNINFESKDIILSIGKLLSIDSNCNISYLSNEGSVLSYDNDLFEQLPTHDLKMLLESIKTSEIKENEKIETDK